MMKLISGCIVVLLGLHFPYMAMASKDNNCFDCHEKQSFSQRIVHRPVAQGKCYQCHNPHVAKHEGLLPMEVGKLCVSCHEVAGGHAECLSCHNPHTSNQNGLLRQNLSASCLECHDTIEQKFKFEHAPFTKGQCKACHNPHEAQNIAVISDLRQDSVRDKICLSCHEKEGIQAKHNSFPADVKGCLFCHNPHGSEKANLMRNELHKPYEKGCKSCHGKGKQNMENCLSCHQNLTEKLNTISNHFSDPQGNACILCHSPHAGDDKNLLKGSQVQLCGACHADTLSRTTGKLYNHPLADNCSECHEVHGSNRLAMLREDGVSTCKKCHEKADQLGHPVGDNVIDPQTGQIVTCVSCHYPMGTDFKYNLRFSGKDILCIQCHRNY